MTLPIIHAATLSRFLVPAVLIGGLAVTSCASIELSFDDAIDGSGTITTETTTVEEFDGLVVSEALDVRLEFGGAANTIDITIDDNLHQELDVEVSDGVLDVSVAPAEGVDSTETIVLQLPDEALTNVAVAEAATLKATLPPTNDLDLAGDTASRLEVTIDTDTASIKATDAATIEIDGRADAVSVVAETASTVDLRDTEVTTATVTAREAATIDVKASGQVTGEANEASTVRVWGTTDVAISTAESSRVAINE